MKRYLLAKRAWLARARPDLRHTLVIPGPRTRATADGLVSIAAPLIPFGDGYRIPASLRKWTRIIAHLKPNLIEAGDAYVPGHAALEAAEATGAATVGFCHSDPAAWPPCISASGPPPRRRSAGPSSSAALTR